MKLTPTFGSYLSAARTRPAFASLIRSSRSRPRFWYFFATENANRRFASINFSRAASRSARLRFSSRITRASCFWSSAASTGMRPVSAIYRSMRSASRSAPEIAAGVAARRRERVRGAVAIVKELSLAWQAHAYATRLQVLKELGRIAVILTPKERLKFRQFLANIRFRAQFCSSFSVQRLVASRRGVGQAPFWPLIFADLPIRGGFREEA